MRAFTQVTKNVFTSCSVWKDCWNHKNASSFNIWETFLQTSRNKTTISRVLNKLVKMKRWSYFYSFFVFILLGSKALCWVFFFGLSFFTCQTLQPHVTQRQHRCENRHVDFNRLHFDSEVSSPLSHVLFWRPQNVCSSKSHEELAVRVPGLAWLHWLKEEGCVHVHAGGVGNLS